jgi:hypothetical protein
MASLSAVHFNPLSADSDTSADFSRPTSRDSTEHTYTSGTPISLADSSDSQMLGTAQQEHYTFDRLLGRWAKNTFLIRWLDGSRTWEPRENILDTERLEKFETHYAGWCSEAVKVLSTRKRKGKVEYRVHFVDRPDSEDWWISEKDMSPELVRKHKPNGKRNLKRKKV